MTENAEINPNKTPQPKSRLDFVFVDHGSENVSRIIDAIVESDGDIIAIEKLRDGFGQGTYEQKHCDSEAATAMLKARDEGGEPGRSRIGRRRVAEWLSAETKRKR